MNYNMVPHSSVSAAFRPLCDMHYSVMCRSRLSLKQKLYETYAIVWIYTMLPPEHGAFNKVEDMGPPMLLLG